MPALPAFKQTRDEQTLWYDVEAWNKLVDGWKGQGDGLSPQEAKLRAEMCGQFVTQHPPFPGDGGDLRYQRYAEAIARRASADDSPATKLRRLLSDIFVNHLWMVTIQGEQRYQGKSIMKRYYSTKEPE